MGRVSEAVSAIAVFAVAFCLRVYRLDIVPRGILHDEAYNGIDAERILDGARPIFLVANNGREALFMYLQAVTIGIFGPTDLALRSVSAALGFLTVPATYVLFRRFFGKRVALLGAAWLALSLWHVIFSRIGLRAISLPLVECLAFYCSWRALFVDSKAEVPQDTRPREPSPLARGVWAIFAGLSIGVSLYTYTSARFVPFVLIGLVGYLLVWHPARRRDALLVLALSGLTALLVFAPEGWFFVQHPYAFVKRADDVSIFNPDLSHGDLAAALRDALARNLGMFSFVGDAHWDRNISHRPVFDPVSSVLLLLGLMRALRGWRRPANALVVIWLVVMLAPGVIASRDAPDFLRVVGVIPAIFVLPALGADWILEWARRSLPRREELTTAVLALGFLCGAYLTYSAYFVTWASAPGVATQFNSDLWEATSQGIQASRTATSPIYVGAGDSDLPALAYRFHHRAESLLFFFNPARSLVFPARSGATYYFAERVRPSPPALAYLDSRYETVAMLPSGLRVLRYHLSSPPDFSPTTPLPARFGESVEVLGFDVPTDVQAGKSLTVRWYWRIRATDSRELTFTNQLFDAANHRLGILDDRAFAPGYWPSGTEGISTFGVPVDASATSGPVWLQLAIYDRATFGRLPVFDPQGHSVGDFLKLGPIKIHGKAPPAPLIAHPLRTHFSDGIDLKGYDIAQNSDSVHLTLYWSPRARPSENYTVFVHALGKDGKLVGQADSPPQDGNYPTAVWDAGETIVDRHDIRVDPANVAAFAIGLYVPATGKRLPVVGDLAGGDTVTVSSGR